MAAGIQPCGQSPDAAASQQGFGSLQQARRSPSTTLPHHRPQLAPTSEPTLPATAPPLAGSPHPVRPARKILAKPGSGAAESRKAGETPQGSPAAEARHQAFPCRQGRVGCWRPGKRHQRPDAGRGLTLDIIDGRLSSSVGQRRAPSEGCSAARPSRLTSPPPSGS